MSFFQNRPAMWQEGDVLYFRRSPKEILKVKSANSQVKCVVEWEGYEGILYDIIWADGDTWTLSGFSSTTITDTLKACGLSDFPMEKKPMVFRPA